MRINVTTVIELIEGNLISVKQFVDVNVSYNSAL